MAVDARADRLTLTTASTTDAFVRGAPVELDSSGNVINSTTEGSLAVIGFVNAPLPALSAAAQRQIGIRVQGMIECTGIAEFDAGEDNTIGPGDYVVSYGASGYVRRVIAAGAIDATAMNAAGGAVLGMVVYGDITEPGSSSTTGTIRVLIKRM